MGVDFVWLRGRIRAERENDRPGTGTNVLFLRVLEALAFLTWVKLKNQSHCIYRTESRIRL